MFLLFFDRSTRSRKQKARHAAEEHRRQLQALLLNKSPSRGSVNGINDDEDLHDDGTELLGNFDMLRVIRQHCWARLPPAVQERSTCSSPRRNVDQTQESGRNRAYDTV